MKTFVMRSFLTWCCLLATATNGHAMDAAPDKALSSRRMRGPQPVKAELITEHASIQPGGQTHIGVRFDLEPGWHIYAKQPGDAGLPTTIAWSVPDSLAHWVTFGPLRYPIPKRFIDPGNIRTFGYSDPVVLASELELSSTLKPGQIIPQRASVGPPSVMGDSILVKAKASWLACNEICIPGSADLQLHLPVRPDLPPLSSEAKRFQ